MQEERDIEGMEVRKRKGSTGIKEEEEEERVNGGKEFIKERKRKT